jgi:5'-3' exonuclease
MGIQGLHKELKSITRKCSIAEYKNKKVAIDAYVWLHKGTYCCAADLCQNIETDKYLSKGKHLIGLLKHHKVIPVVVFDGAYLPSKSGTEYERRQKREETLATAKDLLRSGNAVEANNYFKKAVEVTPFMAFKFMQWLKEQNVQYFVAPYEADAQLAYLARTGYVDCVISEDSDLVAFQTPKMFFKMNDYGEGDEIVLNNLASNTGLNFSDFSHDMVIRWCIVSGCDYLPSLPKIGIRTAHKIVKDNKTMTKILAALRNEVGASFPDEYDALFEQAELTFKYQRVFNPITETVTTLTPLPDDIDPNAIDFCGKPIEDDLAKQICYGHIDPITHEPFIKTMNRIEKNNVQQHTGRKIVNYFTTKTTSIVASRASLKPFKPPRSSQEQQSVSLSPGDQKENDKPKRVVVSKYFRNVEKDEQETRTSTITLQIVTKTEHETTKHDCKEHEDKIILSNSSTESVMDLDMNSVVVKDKKSLSQDSNPILSQIITPKKSLSQDSGTSSPYFQSPLINNSLTRIGVPSSIERKTTPSSRVSIFEKYLAKKRVHNRFQSNHSEMIDNRLMNSQSLSSGEDIGESQNSCFDETDFDIELELSRPIKRSRPESDALCSNSTMEDAILIDSDDDENETKKKPTKNLFEMFMTARRSV